MTAMDIVRLHAIVEGMVQGVGFRSYVQQAANALHLAGWVRNRWDGSVEVVAEGERPLLERLVSALWRGPFSAEVTHVTEEWLPASGEFRRFQVRLTLE